MRGIGVRVSLLGLVALAVSGQRDSSPFGAWQRISNGPVIAPQGEGWESAGTFNPSVIWHDGQIVMLYRAQDSNGTSRLGYATSADGIRFLRRPEPVLSPETEYEKGGGLEDPRLVKIDDTYYLTYTGYNKTDAQLCLATSKDLVHWDRKGVILPAYRGPVEQGLDQGRRHRAGKDRWKVLDVLSRDRRRQDRPDGPRLLAGPGALDRRARRSRPAAAARPVRLAGGRARPSTHRDVRRHHPDLQRGRRQRSCTAQGLSASIRADPRRVLSRTETPVFAPETDWEKVGQVPNVVFVEGMVFHGGRWLFYYGGADKYVGVAEAAAR